MNAIQMEKCGRSDNLGDIPSIQMLGVKVHKVDMTCALEIILGFIRSGKPHIVVTADSSGLALAQTDKEFHDLVNSADLVTPDSAGILMGASILGTPLIQRVSGVDIARELCRLSADAGFGVFFLGAEPGVADLAAENLSRLYPGMRVAGSHHGYFGPEEDEDIVRMVRDSGAEVLFVAMGIPRQEKWIRRYMDGLGVCVAMGVGGSLDVFSGKVKRAPVWFQKHGLEWAYRLASNPSKISKVATLPRFLLMVLREKFSRRCGFGK